MKPLMTSNEVAQYLNVNIYTVYRLAKNGKLRGIKMGKNHSGWRFRPAQVEGYLKWLESKTREEFRG